MGDKIDLRKKRQIIIAMIIMILIIVLGKFIYDSYHIYRKTIVGQQQQQLLTISKSLTRSLQMYFAEEVNKLAVIEESNTLYKELLLTLPKNGQSQFEKITKPFYKQCNLIGLYMVDAQGVIRFKSTLSGENEDYLLGKEEVINQIDLSKNRIGEAYEWREKSFIMPIMYPIYYKGKYIGAFVGILSLDSIYNKLIAPTKVGEQGYVMVKNSSRNIIMHPAKEQIGIKIVEDRQKRFPKFYFEDLKKLEMRQYTEEEGVEEYYSYWWNQNSPIKVKKIGSFCKVDLGGTFWVLAVVMDYSEIVAPIQNNLMRLLALAFTVIFTIIVTGTGFVILRKKQEDLIVETEYLKNINYTLKELQSSEKKLIHYQKLQTIGTLTGGIAHELNNLLTPILGYSQLAAQTMSGDNEYYEDMKEICDAALKSKELIQQISLLSRKESLDGKYRIIDISEEILKGLKMVKIVKDANIEIDKQIQMNCGYIQGSTTHIQQILINLCNNACQAMKERGGIVTVRLEKIEKEQQKYACLTIKDTGCGIEDDLIDRVFDPFFTTKGVGEGTGIGLSIVQSIVENYKGVIDIESKQGKGSIFKVYLPIIEDKPIQEKAEKKQYTLEKQIKILVVEDNVRVTKLLKKSLTKMGYETTIQTDPIKAVELFKDNPMEYSLVITDYAMPNLTGAKLINKIKEIRSDIKVILITGVIEPEVVKQIKQHVIDDFIIKPIEYDELSKKIYRLFLQDTK